MIKSKEENSYSFSRSELYTYIGNNEIYIHYYFWLNNKLNYYERTYNRLQDLIADIG